MTCCRIAVFYRAILAPMAFMVALAAGVAAATLGGGQSTGSASSGAGEWPAAVIFPPEGAVLRAGKIIIIGRDTDVPLRVGGKLVLWQYRHRGIGALEVVLPPGQHEIGMGSSKRQITVVDESCSAPGDRSPSGQGTAPAAGDWIRWHPMQPSAESCEACHRGKNTRGGWPPVPTPEACFPCHTLINLEAIHAHPMEHLYHCQDCHHMHAAPREHLLTKPPKELCRVCHEA